jgi:transcriptional regulator GlxA family with amidase domain
MRLNLHRPLRRGEIAAAVHLSEPHLARIFRSATGRSVVQRLTELRVAIAKSLLLESTLSVGQIAGEVGIISFSHFARTFKSQVGVSPGDYRRTGGRSWG